MSFGAWFLGSAKWFAALTALLFQFATTAEAATGVITLQTSPRGERLRDLMPQQTHDVSVNGGTGVFFGLLLPIAIADREVFEAQVSAGYLFDTDRDTKVSFSRFPLEALYFYRHLKSGLRIGYGAVYHTAGQVSGSAPATVEGSFGGLVEAGWLLPSVTTQTLSFGVRYLRIRYRSEAFSRGADGSNVGFLLSLFF